MPMIEIKKQTNNINLILLHKKIIYYYVFLTKAKSRSAVCISSNFLLKIFKSLPANSSCETSNFDTF